LRYPPSSLKKWEKTAKRHHIRDSVFLPSIIKYFRAGSILELGAGCGQISEKLQGYGFETIGSDLESFFVDYMRGRGMEAYEIDALDISGSIDRKFDNVFCQGLVPHMSREAAVAEKTYSSIHGALKDRGRFISIFCTYIWKKRIVAKNVYLSLKEHLELINRMNEFTVIDTIGHQLFPTGLYTEKNKYLLNYLDFKLGRIVPNRNILILEKK
jgi:SAM-dependent methyltransferase